MQSTTGAPYRGRQVRRVVIDTSSAERSIIWSRHCAAADVGTLAEDENRGERREEERREERGEERKERREKRGERTEERKEGRGEERK